MTCVFAAVDVGLLPRLVLPHLVSFCLTRSLSSLSIGPFIHLGHAACGHLSLGLRSLTFFRPSASTPQAAFRSLYPESTNGPSVLAASRCRAPAAPNRSRIRYFIPCFVLRPYSIGLSCLCHVSDQSRTLCVLRPPPFSPSSSPALPPPPVSRPRNWNQISLFTPHSAQPASQPF